jgi:hypothetical protein
MDERLKTNLAKWIAPVPAGIPQSARLIMTKANADASKFSKSKSILGGFGGRFGKGDAGFFLGMTLVFLAIMYMRTWVEKDGVGEGQAMAQRKGTITTRPPCQRTGTGTSKTENGNATPRTSAAGLDSNGRTARASEAVTLRKSRCVPTNFSSRAAVHITTIWPTGSRPRAN